MANTDHTTYSSNLRQIAHDLEQLPDSPTNAELAAALKKLVPVLTHISSIAGGLNTHLSSPHPKK